MAARNISFNGNVLQSDHIFVSDIDDASAPTRQLSIYTLGHANASKIPYDQYTGKNITLTGTIYGDTIPDLDSRIDLFKSYFNGIDKNLDIDFNGTTRRYIATMQAISISRPGGLAYATFTVNLVCTQPFGRNVTSTVLCNFTPRQMITNPYFNTNTTGWTAYNAATLQRTSADHGPAGTGIFSMQVSTTGTGVNALQGATGAAVTVTNGSTYTLSFYVKGVAGITVRCQLTDTVDTYSSIVTDGTWQRVSVTRTASSTTLTPAVIIEGANTSVKAPYVDDFLLESGSSPTTVFDSSARGPNTYADSFTFGGTAPVQQPVITQQFTAGTLGAGSVTIGNNNTGQQIVVTRTWAVNDILVIDTVNKIVYVNSAEVDFVGAFPEFPPGTGVLGYSSSVPTSSQLFTYKVEYYPQYL